MTRKNFEFIKDLENWLLYSDIRIKEGINRGGFYGWKNLESTDIAARYPFIYNEVIGYSLSCFSFIYSENNKLEYIESMKLSLEYIQNNTNYDGLLNTGKRTDMGFKDKGIIENQIYCFDNGIVLAGLINYYKVTNDQEVFSMAESLANALIKYFFRNDNLYSALLGTDLSPLEYGSGKWSTTIGSYHAKLAIGFLDLYNSTANKKYLKICNKLCEFTIRMQNKDGSFSNNSFSNNEIYLHPHLYACEGITYVASLKKDKELLIKGLRGIEWAISNLTPKGGIPRSNSERIDQADCTSQLLRLVLLYHKDLEVHLKLPIAKIEYTLDALYNRISSFFIESENAIRYNDNSLSACTWCTMFTLQALVLWDKRINNSKNHFRLDFFI